MNRSILFILLLGLVWQGVPTVFAQETGPELPAAVGEQPDGTADPEETGADEDPPSTVGEGADEGSAEITELLKRRFGQIEGLADVEVEVGYGIVVLKGSALSSQDSEQAVAIAEKTDGVVAVEDRIEIETAIEERVVPAYDRSLERIREIISHLPLLALALMVIIGFAFLARFVGSWKYLFHRLTDNPFLQDLIRQFVQAIVWVVGLIIALDILNATALVGAVLGSVGVLGLAVGFAFRDLAENYISSVLLSLRQPFSPMDHVVIGSHEGKVIRLTSRATVLMTLEGNHLRIPNSEVFKGVILNYTRNPRRRFDFDVGVGVEEDLIEARRLGLEQLDALQGVLQDPEPMAIITELGDSNVIIRFYGWVDQTQADFAKVKGEAIRRVKICLEEAGMDLPEPIYRVVLRQAGSALQAADDVGPDEGEPAKPRPVLDHPDEDIAVDTSVEREIHRERREKDETDLLSEDAPEE